MNLKKLLIRGAILVSVVLVFLQFTSLSFTGQGTFFFGVDIGPLGNCSNVTMEELVAISSRRQFTNGVPMIVHYDYKGRLVPEQYMALVNHCVAINPGVKFVFWTDTSSLALVSRYFSDSLDLYKSFLGQKVHPLKKSDVIRYFIVLKFGGIYMDLDTGCQRPLEEVMRTSPCLLSREAEVQSRIMWNYDYIAMNSFMACVAGHRFFRTMVDKLIKDNNQDILYNTGPIFLTNIFKQYTSVNNGTDSTDPKMSISLAPSEMFSPYIEPALEKHCKKPTAVWTVKGCQELTAYRKVEKKKLAGAVVVHLFYHLGYKFANHLIRRLLDICSLGVVYMVN